MGKHDAFQSVAHETIEGVRKINPCANWTIVAASIHSTTASEFPLFPQLLVAVLKKNLSGSWVGCCCCLDSKPSTMLSVVTTGSSNSGMEDYFRRKSNTNRWWYMQYLKQIVYLRRNSNGEISVGIRTWYYIPYILYRSRKRNRGSIIPTMKRQAGPSDVEMESEKAS